MTATAESTPPVDGKLRRPEAIGVPELWLVDPQRERVLVFRRSTSAAAAFDVELDVGEGDTLTSPILPGCELDVTAIFDR